MFANIFFGVLTMVLCLLLQAFLILVVLRFYTHHLREIENEDWLPTIRVIWGVMALLFIGNIAQISVWAALFLVLGEFSGFETAFYHSAVNFSTLGYGDMVMSEQHRLLGPIEAVNGVLMIGVSTAVLFSAFDDALTRTLGARGKTPQ